MLTWLDTQHKAYLVGREHDDVRLPQTAPTAPGARPSPRKPHPQPRGARLPLNGSQRRGARPPPRRSRGVPAAGAAPRSARRLPPWPPQLRSLTDPALLLGSSRLLPCFLWTPLSPSTHPFPWRSKIPRHLLRALPSPPSPSILASASQNHRVN